VSPTQPSPPTVAEIAALTAWCRKLSAQDHRADPDELAAYQAAKTNLLARITGHPDHHQEPQ
jgi:hypothetical protein